MGFFPLALCLGHFPNAIHVLAGAGIVFYYSPYALLKNLLKNPPACNSDGRSSRCSSSSGGGGGVYPVFQTFKSFSQTALTGLWRGWAMKWDLLHTHSDVGQVDLTELSMSWLDWSATAKMYQLWMDGWMSSHMYPSRLIGYIIHSDPILHIAAAENMT